MGKENQESKPTETKTKPMDGEYTTDPGPIKNRGCRDLFFLLIFLLFWLGMFVIAGVAWKYGDLNRLKYGSDSNGNLCGVGANADTPYLFYFLNPTTFQDLETASIANVNRQCVAKCPTNSSIVVCMPGFNVDQTSIVAIASAINSNNCSFGVVSDVVLNRCVPTSVNTFGVLNNSQLLNSVQGAFGSQFDSMNSAVKIFQGIENTWRFIVIGAAIAFVISFLWLYLIQYFASLVVWVTVYFMMISTAALTGYGWYAWYQLSNNQSTALYGYNPLKYLPSFASGNQKTLLAIVAIVTLITVIVWLVLIFVRTRLKLAIEVIKETSKAVRAMPTLVLMPTILNICHLILLGFCLFFILVLSTGGENVAAQANHYAMEYVGKDFNENKVLDFLIIYYVFGLFWGWSMITAIGQTTIAGAIASWYWLRDKKALSKHAVLDSLGRVFRYHLGSLAFGSLIIAIVQLIRFLLMFLEKRVKKSQNKVALFIVRCLQCVFLCLERFLKFLNKNAYIEIAVYGYSFCQAAKRSFELIVRNAFRLVVVDKIGDFLLFMGKLMITATTVVISLGLLENYSPAGDFFTAPLIIIGLLSYVIANCFISVFDMGIDTIFLSFCEDCERNDGSAAKPYFMSENLRAFTDKHKKEPNPKPNQ